MLYIGEENIFLSNILLNVSLLKCIFMNLYNSFDIHGPYLFLRALTVGDTERWHRIKRDRFYVMNSTASTWAFNIVMDIKMSQAQEERLNLISTGIGLGLGFRMIGMNATFKQLDVDEVCQSWRTSFKRVIFLDFGGTIVSEDNVKKFRGFNATGATVLIPSSVKKMLEELCKEKQNTVFIISGKERVPLAKAVEGIPQLGVAAEHGFYYRYTLACINLLIFSDCHTCLGFFIINHHRIYQHKYIFIYMYVCKYILKILHIYLCNTHS